MLFFTNKILQSSFSASSVRHYETDNGRNALAKIIINYHIPIIISYFFNETGEFYLELSRI